MFEEKKTNLLFVKIHSNNFKNIYFSFTFHYNHLFKFNSKETLLRMEILFSFQIKLKVLKFAIKVIEIFEKINKSIIRLI